MENVFRRRQHVLNAFSGSQKEEARGNSQVIAQGRYAIYLLNFKKSSKSYLVVAQMLRMFEYSECFTKFSVRDYLLPDDWLIRYSFIFSSHITIWEQVAIRDFFHAGYLELKQYIGIMGFDSEYK